MFGCMCTASRTTRSRRSSTGIGSHLCFALPSDPPGCSRDGRAEGAGRDGGDLAPGGRLGCIRKSLGRGMSPMTIEINGMAHMILTVSQFDAARAFYGRLLPEFGMKVVHDGEKLFYCVGARTAIGIEPCDSAFCRGALRAAAGGSASPLPARPVG